MDERFGRYIKNIRRQRGISLDEIAFGLNMPSMLWLDIENGELRPPRLGKLLKLSETLQLSTMEKSRMLQLAGNELEAPVMSYIPRGENIKSELTTCA